MTPDMIKVNFSNSPPEFETFRNNFVHRFSVNGHFSYTHDGQIITGASLGAGAGASRGGLTNLILGRSFEEGFIQGAMGGAVGGFIGYMVGLGFKGLSHDSKKSKATKPQSQDDSKARLEKRIMENATARADEYIVLPNGQQVRVSSVGGSEVNFYTSGFLAKEGTGYQLTGPTEVVLGHGNRGLNLDIANTISLGATVWGAGLPAGRHASNFAKGAGVAATLIGFSGTLASMYNDYIEDFSLRTSTKVDFTVGVFIGSAAVIGVICAPPLAAGAAIAGIGYYGFMSSPAGIQIKNRIDIK